MIKTIEMKNLTTVQTMPWACFAIIVVFLYLDTFTEHEMSDSESAMIYMGLVPIIAICIKLSYESHKKKQGILGNITLDDLTKLRELLQK